MNPHEQLQELVKAHSLRGVMTMLLSNYGRTESLMALSGAFHDISHIHSNVRSIEMARYFGSQLENLSMVDRENH